MSTDGAIAASERGGDPQVMVPEPPSTGDTSILRPRWAPDGERVGTSGSHGHPPDLMVDDQQLTDGEDVFLFSPEWTRADRLLYTADGGSAPSPRPGGDRAGDPVRGRHPDPGGGLRQEGPRLRRPQRPRVTGDPHADPVAGRHAGRVRRPERPVGDDDRQRPRRVTDDDVPRGQPGLVARRRPAGVLLRPRPAPRTSTSEPWPAARSGGSPRWTAPRSLRPSHPTARAWPSRTRRRDVRARPGDRSGARARGAAVRPGPADLVRRLVTRSPIPPSSRTRDRFREGISQILTVDVASGELAYHAPGGAHARSRYSW